jgi:hypothetical protein
MYSTPNSGGPPYSSSSVGVPSKASSQLSTSSSQDAPPSSSNFDGDHVEPLLPENPNFTSQILLQFKRVIQSLLSEFANVGTDGQIEVKINKLTLVVGKFLLCLETILNHGLKGGFLWSSLL